MTGFSPYVLYRKGTLGLAELASVVPERTWRLYAQAVAQRERRAGLAERLADALHDAIPRLPADQRRAWLAVRRDVHNDRTPRLPAAADGVPCANLLDEWIAERDAADTLDQQIEAAYAEELAAARKALAQVALGEDFQRGVQLSGEDVYREVATYAANPFDTSRRPAKRRRAESTITSFAYRVALKPSPFGSFTEIGAHEWAARPVSGQRVAQTRLSVGLLAWMSHQLHRLDGAEEFVRVRLNNSLAVAGDRVTFVRRPLEGADDGFMPDRVVTAKYSGLVRLLRDLLGEQDRSERELRDQLVAAGLSIQDAGATIDKLVTLGLCHRGLGLPDQQTRAAGAIADLLADHGVVEVSEIFRALQGIEDRYAAASAGERTELLAELRGLVRRFVELCGCEPPAKEAMRAAMYEDVGTRAVSPGWRPDLLETNADGLALLQRIVPILDDATIEKLGLYRFFVDRYGEDHPGVGLMELYWQFAELSPTDASKVMCGVGDEHSQRVQALRTEFLDRSLARVDDTDIRLDPATLREFADALPRTVVPWPSAAYRVQFGAELVVVNGVTTGHGVFFSRYCDLLGHDLEHDGWNLRDALGGHIAGRAPRQTDITAALGLNFNLHPRLSPLELVYPGSVARPDAAGVLTLADVVVRANPAIRQLDLVSTVDDTPIDLVPLNFLYPAAAPMLYRFLCAFAPTRTYHGGLWDQLPAGQQVDTVRPRVLLGGLVLDRRCWRFRADELPALDGLDRQELGALQEFDAWRRDHGIPRTSFFRMFAPPRATGAERNLLEETRQWALEARSARLHKPHFLDTHNPFLLHVLAKQARTTPGGQVTFTECLPDIADYGGSGPDSAEEYFVELNLEGNNHG